MATILAIDASTDVCSVALLRHGICTELQSDEPRAHAQTLLPMVDRLLSENEISLSDVQAIAYGSGPGSFTGLRIGLGIAQGLAFGAGLPMVGISSLEAMAVAQCSIASNADEHFICVLDARMSEVYWSKHRVHRSESYVRVHTQVPPRLDAIADASTEINNCLREGNAGRLTLAGSGVQLLELPSLANNSGCGHSVKGNAVPSAFGVALLAREQLAEGRVVNAEDAQLTYLRNSVAWNKRVRIRQNPSDS